VNKETDTAGSIGLFEKIVEKLTKLSTAQRISICVVTTIILIATFVFLSFIPQQKQIKKLNTEYTEFKQKLTVAKVKAAQFSSFKEKMKHARAKYLIAKKALPEKKEIPSLLSSISKVGYDTGLEFPAFTPQPETIKDFFSKIPVKLELKGTYHNIAVFFAKIARLPRIVNIDNVKMSSSSGGKLNTSCTAITYRFLESPSNKPSNK